jgi:hypothetical protein
MSEMGRGNEPYPSWRRLNYSPFLAFDLGRLPKRSFSRKSKTSDKNLPEALHVASVSQRPCGHFPSCGITQEETPTCKQVNIGMKTRRNIMQYTHTCNFHKTLDWSKIAPISNCKWNKPKGGFWLSINDGWEHWCECEMPEWLVGTRYQITVKPWANIYWIKTDNDALWLPDNPLMDDSYKDGNFLGMKFIDFEELSLLYDAVGVMIQSGDISYRILNGWDCDSLLVMNPKILGEYKEIETYIPDPEKSIW